MTAYMMTDSMLMQTQHFNEGYHQHLMMQAALRNFREMAEPLQPEELDCEVELLNADLWRQFHDLGTEMIITKNGRRMFPPICVRVRGLGAGAQYCVSVELQERGARRWTRAGGAWAPAGGPPAPPAPPPAALHPDAPAPPARWDQPVTFNRMKLTNNVHDHAGNIVLTSMHKYQPRIRVSRVGGAWPAEKVVCFPETEFIAVTAYQNEQITQLKIDNNPFAKGFRKCGQGRCKRKSRSTSPDMNKTSESASPSEDMSAKHDRSITKSPVGSISSSSTETSSIGSPMAETASDRSSQSSQQTASKRSRMRLSEHAGSSSSPLADSAYFLSPLRSPMMEESSVGSPLRSPSHGSSSSGSPGLTSVSSRLEEGFPRMHEVYNPHLMALEEARYLQLAEWARRFVYGPPVWAPPQAPLAPLPPAHPAWHRPSPPSPPADPCRPHQPPKGSSFTIKALIGEN